MLQQGGMKEVISYEKRRGETPLQALSRLREELPRFAEEKLSYAGRLDPLAEGLLLVLAGDANKEREKYLNLPKKYVFEILFGWSTDSYDIAGKLVEVSSEKISSLLLIENIKAFVGVHEQSYPPFSSKPVQGKPLFEWAKEGRLSEIRIPKHKVEIFEATILKTGNIVGSELDTYVHESIALLSGDFRQEEILACWEHNLSGKYAQIYDTAVIEITCTSGTYVRVLAQELGEKMGVPALALRIVRTEVGEYLLKTDNF